MSLADRLGAIRAHCAAGSDAESWSALATLADRMETEGRGRDEPVRAVFGLLGDRWSMLILLTLGTGEWRHATLRRIVGTLSAEGAISQRMLTLKLRAMERDGFVRRIVGDEVPPHVAYRLTGFGVALLEQAAALLRWIGDHRAAVIENRRCFDGRDDA